MGKENKSKNMTDKKSGGGKRSGGTGRDKTGKKTSSAHKSSIKVKASAYRHSGRNPDIDELDDGEID